MSAGFTLIEVLLATMLLAAGLALGFATVRAAGATAERGEAMAARNERMRAVSEFLRSRIGGAQGIVFRLDPASGQAQRFTGDAHSMRFVADLPDYLGRGGPHLHELSVARLGDRAGAAGRFPHGGRRQGDRARDARPPEPLADGLRSVQFFLPRQYARRPATALAADLGVSGGVAVAGAGADRGCAGRMA